jgi:hypothetical protein
VLSENFSVFSVPDKVKRTDQHKATKSCVSNRQPLDSGSRGRDLLTEFGLSWNIQSARTGIHILCCAVPCSAARGPLDFLVIRVSTDLEVIQRSTFCAERYCAAEEQDFQSGADKAGALGLFAALFFTVE